MNELRYGKVFSIRIKTTPLNYPRIKADLLEIKNKYEQIYCKPDGEVIYKRECDGCQWFDYKTGTCDLNEKED